MTKTDRTHPNETASGGGRGHETVAILDFGSQYTQLIARRVRALRVLSLVLPGDADADSVRALQVRGVILSGGPASVYAAASPRLDPGVLELDVPVLGICYGLQLVAQHLGGRVAPSEVREYGKATLRRMRSSALLDGLDAEETVWMSHGDAVATLPDGFEVLGTTPDCPHAAVQDPARRLYGLQFHPEVVHTQHGEKLLGNFVYRVCDCRGDWTPENMVQEHLRSIRSRVGDARVLVAVSGGVDSTVLATLAHRAVPDQVETLCVDNGLLRLNETHDVRRRFERLGIPLRVYEAADDFLHELEGVEDPEEKRLRIG
ncbi:MAG: glutamine-hydrolyzing GMP synthase, partial [Candidatus Krumholzibacteriia bacterium]